MIYKARKQISGYLETLWGRGGHVTKGHKTCIVAFTHFLNCMTIKKLAAAAAKSLQSCPTLCDPIDGSPPGSPVPGILQARTLEWVALSFFNA